MKHFAKLTGLLLAGLMCVAGNAFAAKKSSQADDLKPILTFKTSIYEQQNKQ